MLRQAAQRSRGPRTTEAHERRDRRTVDRPLPDRFRDRAYRARRKPRQSPFRRIHRCRRRTVHCHWRAAGSRRIVHAGSFGGAFIDSIEGDPHGIIGLSLPLARHLAGELGITWTDLWNVGRGELEPESKASGNQHAGILPPVENVHQPAMAGWTAPAAASIGAPTVLPVFCWLVANPVSGKVTHVVMQHRAAWSAEGGTWVIPGGATADGESPIEGALRESYEEANITPEDIEVVGSYREDHGPWAYTTVFAFEKPGHTVEPKANDDESMEICWVPIDDVPNRKLLTAMKTDWPRFAARLDELACAGHR